MEKDEARCTYAVAYAVGVMDGLIDVTRGKIDYRLDNLPCHPRDNRNPLWKRGRARGCEAIIREVESLMLGDQDADS